MQAIDPSNNMPFSQKVLIGVNLASLTVTAAATIFEKHAGHLDFVMRPTATGTIVATPLVAPTYLVALLATTFFLTFANISYGAFIIISSRKITH